MSVTELCRSGGFSQPTFLSGNIALAVWNAAKLRELETENNKQKKLLAEAHLDIHAFKSVFSVNR
jgi:putative transposase